MLLKHSWAEGRLGRKSNDKFTTTALDTDKGLSYNQKSYKNIHHSYGKFFKSVEINDRDNDDKIYIDKGAYNSLLRSDNTSQVASASSNQEPHTGRNNTGGLYRPLGFSTYSNSSYAWRPRRSTLSPKVTKSMRESYHGSKVDSTRTDGEIDPTQTKILSSPIKVVLQSSFTNSSADAHNTYNEVHVKDASPNVHATDQNSKTNYDSVHTYSTSRTQASNLLSSRPQGSIDLIHPTDVRNYALQSKVQALQRELDASKKIIEDLSAPNESDALHIDDLGISDTTFSPTPATEFHSGKTGIYGKLWEHAGVTKTFKYATCWEPTSPRHKFLRRTSLASPNHKIVAVLKEEEGLDETINDPNALKRPRFSLKEAHELLCDLKDLSTLSLLRDSTEIFEKHYVYPTHQNYCEDGFESSSIDLTCLLRPCILMKVFTYLGIDDLRSMACTEKKMVLWTSCPVLWAKQAVEVKTALDSIVDCIKQTEESYESYRRGKKALSLITNECIKEVGRNPRPERIVRDVVTAVGLLLHGSTDPFSQIRSRIDPPVQLPLVSWPACQHMLMKKNFLKNLLKHNPVNFNIKRLKRFRPFASHDHLSTQTVEKHNIAFARIANWMHTSSLYCIRQRRLDRKGSKMRSKWLFGKSILKESRRRKKIWEKCEDGWLEGLYAYSAF